MKEQQRNRGEGRAPRRTSVSSGVVLPAIGGLGDQTSRADPSAADTSHVMTDTSQITGAKHWRGFDWKKIKLDLYLTSHVEKDAPQKSECAK